MTSLNKSQRGFFFLLIGSLAAFVHVFSVGIFVNFLRISPLIANAFSFLIAFNVSYLGHKNLTFSGLGSKQLRLPRFFIVAISAGIMNEGLYFIFLQYTHVHYLVALILVLILMSCFSFLCSRYWACR